MPNLADVISSSYIFSGLSAEEQRRVVALAHEKSFDGGEAVLRQYAKDRDVLIVTEGKVRINSFSGELIAEIGSGASIGEMALIDDKPRSATAVAMGQVKVAVIAYDSLWSLMDSEPAIGKKIILNIARVLTERLRKANVELDLAGNR